MHSFRSSLSIAAIAAALAGCAQQPVIPYTVDAHVPVTPQNVSWGHLPAGKAPVLRVRSGQTVSMDTLSHQGVNNGMDPVKFFAAEIGRAHV